MPIYEYECENCGRFEHIHLSGEKALKLCPTCKEKGKKIKVSKLTSAAGLRFKGSGFYITDYANKSKQSESPKGARNGDTKTDIKVSDSKPDSKPQANTGKSNSSENNASTPKEGSAKSENSKANIEK